MPTRSRSTRPGAKPNARDMVKKTGQMAVPVVKIGSEWIVGFDRRRIDRALAAHQS